MVPLNQPTNRVLMFFGHGHPLGVQAVGKTSRFSGHELGCPPQKKGRIRPLCLSVVAKSTSHRSEALEWFNQIPRGKLQQTSRFHSHGVIHVRIAVFRALRWGSDRFFGVDPSGDLKRRGQCGDLPAGVLQRDRLVAAQPRKSPAGWMNRWMNRQGSPEERKPTRWSCFFFLLCFFFFFRGHSISPFFLPRMRQQASLPTQQS